KSSLVRAGLLPRLGRHVLPAFVPAGAEGTEERLAAALRVVHPALPPDLTLRAALDRLRRELPPERKVFIVLDQFEQWLLTRGAGPAPSPARGPGPAGAPAGPPGPGQPVPPGPAGPAATGFGLDAGAAEPAGRAAGQHPRPAGRRLHRGLGQHPPAAPVPGGP